MSKYIVLVLISLWLVACAPSQSAVQIMDTGVGGQTPEEIVQNFFDDLNTAFKDPALGDDTHRGEIVERLVGYFAPNEREDQRATLDTALDNFAQETSKLNPDQSIKFELRYSTPHERSNTGQYALVELPNSSIIMDVIQSTKNGPVNEYHQEEPISKIIGRADGTIPTIKVGKYWFLTEGSQGDTATP